MGGFSGALGSLWVEVGAKIQKFESAMADVSQEIDKTVSNAEKKFAGFDKLGDSLKGVGLGLTAAITLPITGVGIAAANMAKDFELSIRQVTSLLGEAGPAAFAPFSAGVLDISKRMGIDAVGAAKALYEAISAGIPKENALTFLEVASKAAIAGVTETKVAVDGITTVLNSYRLGADQATKVSDAMFTAVNIGKFTFEQLAGSMAIAIPQAELLGVSFQEVLAAASTITSKGVPVSVAMTQIAAAMRSVTAPGKEMEELFQKIGVSSGETLIKTKGFQGAIEAVRAAAEGSSKTLQDAVGRIEGYAAIVSLTGDNAKRARADIDQLNKSAGATDAAFAEINKSFSRQLAVFTNQVKGIGIELGTALLPVATKILEALQPVVAIIGDAVKWFGQLSAPLQTVILGFVALAIAIGPVLIVAGTLASSISSLSVAFGLLAGTGGIVGLTSGLAAFASTAIPAAIAAVTTFATTTLPLALAALGELAFVMLVQAESSLTRFAATTVPLAITSLTTFARTAIPSAIAALSTFAATTIPAATASLTAFASTAIPSAIAGLRTMAASAIPAVIGVLSALGVAAAIAAAAFAGWKLGEWAYKQIPGFKALGDSLFDTLNVIPGLEVGLRKLFGVSSSLATSNATTELAVKKMSEALAKQGVVVSSAGLSTDQYAAKLRDAAKALDSGPLTAHAAAQKALGETFKTLTSDVTTFSAAARSAQDNYTAVSKAFNEGKATADQLGKAHNTLKTTTTDLADALGKHGVVVKSTGLNIAEYADKVRDAAKAMTTKPIDEHRIAIEKAKKEILSSQAAAKITTIAQKELGAAFTGTIKQVDLFSVAVEKAEKSYKGIARAFNEGKASAEQLEQAQTKLRTAQDKLDPTQVLQRSAKAWEETSARYVKSAEEILTARQSLTKADAELAQSNANLAEMFLKSQASMRAEAIKTVEIIVPLSKRPSEALQQSIKAAEALEEAYKQLGQSSGKSLEEQVSKSKRAYELIRDSGTASVGTLNVLWAKYESDRQEAARAAGEKIPEAQKKALDKMKAQIDDHQGKTKEGWASWAKQISTIITDTGKNIVDRFIKAGDLNKQLDEDAAKLEESLAGREQTYTEFADNVATTLADIHADYEADLAKDEETLRESLDERRQDYAEYAADIADNLIKFTKANAKSADKERRALEDSLEDRTRDYDDYVGDVEDRIRDIRSGHARSVATETQNLNDSLSDRKTDYDRYVEDVGIRLARIRAQNKGQFSEEEADLLLSLKRRTEDFQAFQTETITKIGEVAAKHRQEEEQQVKDQQEALARRTRDFNLYRDEITANLAEVTAKHKEAQEQEEADLAASLAKKKAELEKFEADLASQFEGRRADALAKLQKQESDLTASLEKQRAEWEKYKNDIALQLQEIEDKHLGIFGKIAAVGKGIFADIGAAVARFVTEELVGKLFKELTKLAVDILPSLGKAMTDIFGGSAGLAVEIPDWVSGVGDIPGGAPRIPGGGAPSIPGGGGAGGAASGLGKIADVTGIVTGIVNAISGVFSNFQFAAMNKSLDLIEHNSRFAMMFLGERGDGGIVSASLKAVEYLSYITATGDTIGKKLDEWLEPSKNSLQHLVEAIPHTQSRMDEISNSTMYGSMADKENTNALHALRELFATIGTRQPIIQIWVNGVAAPASAVSMKLQGSLIL